MNMNIKLLLVGAGGYATEYLKRLLPLEDDTVKIEGIVEPYYQTCPNKERIDAAGIPVYATMEDFYAAHTADLAMICTPPFLHREQSICALSHGSYVLCEKPIAPTVREAEEMLAAERTYGKWIAIGYQWSFSEAIRLLKQDVLDGVLGRPLFFKTAVSWPRNRAYYARGTGWGGKLTHNGVTVLDSIASNACAHYLHNMLFLLGKTPDTSAEAISVSGTCLRANEIESFDTCAIKAVAENGTPLFFLASHACEKNRNPMFEYRFEKGTVTFSEDDGSVITATFSDGRTKTYGNPFRDAMEKIFLCIDAIRTGTHPVCTVKTATPHTRLIERIHATLPIRNVDDTRIRNNEETNGVYVEGLFEELYRAYAADELLNV
jgi:predicted dehydrogenase